jgi:hypothetical protein
MEDVPQDRAQERMCPLPDSRQVWGKPGPEDKPRSMGNACSPTQLRERRAHQVSENKHVSRAMSR